MIAMLVFRRWTGYTFIMSDKRKNPKREPVEVAAIIPARGGKQSVPLKNLQELGGKSLVAWAVDVAFESDLIDVVIVSTEDEKIAAEARSLGALIAPRPAKYAQPDSGDAGFYHHAVTWMEEEYGWTPELLVNLRPTGPLRFASDIDSMIDYMKNHPEADGLKSVIPAPIHPYKMWTLEMESDGEDALGGAGKMEPVFDNEHRQHHGPDQPRQVIQAKFPVYWQDAQIDVTRRKFVIRPQALERDNVWGSELHGYVLDPRTSADLDTEEDLRRAEKIYHDLLKEKGEK